MNEGRPTIGLLIATLVMIVIVASCSAGETTNTAAPEPTAPVDPQPTATGVPTPTPSPTPTATPSPTATPTPSPTPTPTPIPVAAFPCVDGLSDGYACDAVGLEALVDVAALGGREVDLVSDIWGWTDPETGAEIAIVLSAFSTAFVDVSVPAAPVVLGTLPMPAEVTNVGGLRDVKVHADHAFIVAESPGHGLQVVDLTQLRDVEPGGTLEQTTRADFFSTAHNIGLNENTGFAYAVGSNNCGGGLQMIDVSVPSEPTDAGCYGDQGYVHDVQCVIYAGPAADFEGRELCFGSNEDRLAVADVTDKDAVVDVAQLPYEGSGYTHQGWLTEDQRYFVLNDELDELNVGHTTRTRVFDVSDPAAPTLVGFYDGPVLATDHNLFVVGDLVYMANYTSGLRIVRLDDPATAAMTEVGFFDQIPGEPSLEFAGSFSVYPFFDSGTIVMSSMGEGLFILRPDVVPTE